MPSKRFKKRLIVDVGSGSGEFTKLLRKRNPRDRVIGIDRNPESKADIKDITGSFFKSKLKEPGRVKKVWLNHVDFFSKEGFVEFKAMVNVLSPKTPIMITVRKENVKISKTAFQYAGLQVRSERDWTPKMLGSSFTKQFYDQAMRGNSKKMPVRFVVVKPA